MTGRSGMYEDILMHRPAAWLRCADNKHSP
jgi:hypothetical protein